MDTRRWSATGFVFGVIAAASVFGTSFAFAGPANGPHTMDAPMTTGAEIIVLDKKLKGNLPITELTADEAITHALNRLAYGPRPEDVAHIGQVGLEKWIDE